MNIAQIKRSAATLFTALMACAEGGAIDEGVIVAANTYNAADTGSSFIQAGHQGGQQVQTNSCATHTQLANGTTGSSVVCSPGQSGKGGSGASLL